MLTVTLPIRGRGVSSCENKRKEILKELLKTGAMPKKSNRGGSGRLSTKKKFKTIV